MARTRDTTKPASAAAPAASSPSLAASSAPLPLRARSVDALLAFWFVLFAFSTTFTDLHNFTASYLGVEVSQLKGMTLLWPPRVLTQLYFHWAETVDPLLYQNPVWWQCIEWVNLLVLTPFAFVGVVAFLRGSSWVRIPAIVVSSFTLYSLILCIGTTLYGPVRSNDPSTFTGIYTLYLTQPALVILRLWHDRPFHRLSPAANSILSVLTVANMAVFFSYVLKWMVVHGGSTYLPAAALPWLQAVRSLP